MMMSGNNCSSFFVILKKQRNSRIKKRSIFEFFWRIPLESIFVISEFSFNFFLFFEFWREYRLLVSHVNTLPLSLRNSHFYEYWEIDESRETTSFYFLKRKDRNTLCFFEFWREYWLLVSNVKNIASVFEKFFEFSFFWILRNRRTARNDVVLFFKT